MLIVTDENFDTWPHYPKVTFTSAGRVQYAPHYFRWKGMCHRCEKPSNPEYKRYGARGIKVCREWKNFWNFHKWVSDTYEAGKTIDRIDNNKGYSPKNCRWATPLEQQLNSRITPARLAAIKFAKKFAVKKHDAIYGNVKTRTKKNCFFCKKIKPVKSFCKNRSTSDGLQKHCADCNTALMRKYRQRRKGSNANSN